MSITTVIVLGYLAEGALVLYLCLTAKENQHHD